MNGFDAAALVAFVVLVPRILRWGYRPRRKRALGCPDQDAARS